MVGTRSGKSLLFQALSLIIRNIMIFVIIPNLSLIDDQYQWMKKYGLLVVALISDVIAANPIIWKKIEAGDYAHILALSEVLLQYVSVFVLYTIWNRYSVFNKHLVCITIDEAYLIYGWRIFWKEYARHKILRHCFPKVLMMILSTTIMPNVLGYVKKSLHLWAPTRFYK